MDAPPAGAVVLVPFLFSDLSRAKRRPAVLLAAVGRGDLVLCQITSNSYGDPLAVRITDADFGEGGFRRESFARPRKLFTANESLVVGAVGHLRREKHRELVSAIVNLLNSGVSEEAG